MAQEILEDPRRFKEMLGIGEDTFPVLKVRNKLPIVLGVAGAAAGALLASSSVVATTFFPTSGVLATIGLGEPAATPLGWVVVVAALAGGGASLAAKKFSDRLEGVLMHNFSKYLSTGPDKLAREMLGLMLPLSLKIAKIGGDQITASEGKVISKHYAEEWGYTGAFVDEVMKKVEGSLGNASYAALAEPLVGFCNDNKDCNRDAIVESLRNHLKELIEEEENPRRREEKTIALEHLEGQFQKLKTAAGPSQAPQP